MQFDTWLAFALASLLLTMTPGPSILLGVVHSMQFGPKKVAITALGDITANFLQMVSVGVGLGVVIANSALAFSAIKWFGVATLLYMGLQMVLSKPREFQRQNTAEVMPARKRFLSGFLVAAGNPKAIVFFTAFFPQFIDPAQPLFPQMLIMCSTMAILDFSWVMIYAVCATKLVGFMGKHPACINRAGGSVLMAAAGFLALSSRSANS